MKEVPALILRFTLFIISWVLVSYPAIYYGIVKTELYLYWIEGKEVYDVIEKAGDKGKTEDIIVIGDSVGNQLYFVADEISGITGLASTMAISMVGQYLVLNKVVENNKSQGKRVYLIYHPSSFKEDLNTKFTYHYFLKPFFYEENYLDIEAPALSRIQQIPYYEYCQWPWLKATNITPNFESVPSDNQDQFYLSEISQLYLQKMKKLAKENDFTLKILAPPIQEKFREYDFARFVNQIDELGMSAEFTGYVDDIQYFSAELFQDEVHYKDPAALGVNYLNLR